MFSVFLLSYRNTSETLGELEKAVVLLVFPQHFSFSQTSTRVSLTRQKHGSSFLFLKIEGNMKIVGCQDRKTSETIEYERMNTNTRSEEEV